MYKCLVYDKGSAKTLYGCSVRSLHIVVGFALGFGLGCSHGSPCKSVAEGQKLAFRLKLSTSRSIP